MPTASRLTKRLHANVDGHIVELVHTDAKWFDKKANKGGGGAIDLTMHLFNLPFAVAVKRLNV